MGHNLLILVSDMIIFQVLVLVLVPIIYLNQNQVLIQRFQLYSGWNLWRIGEFETRLHP